jgi:CRISPR-associated DxTHG motif protein
MNGTLGVTGAATLSSTLAVTDAVTLSTTSATPTSLLGKDGSNVVGSVTTVAQTGLFGRGSVSNEETDANGNITVAHGFNFTPIMAFANLPGQTTNIINVKAVDGTNITFVVRDGATNNVLNTQTVTKIEFFAIK